MRVRLRLRDPLARVPGLLMGSSGIGGAALERDSSSVLSSRNTSRREDTEPMSGSISARKVDSSRLLATPPHSAASVCRAARISPAVAKRSSGRVALARACAATRAAGMGRSGVLRTGGSWPDRMRCIVCTSLRPATGLHPMSSS